MMKQPSFVRRPPINLSRLMVASGFIVASLILRSFLAAAPQRPDRKEGAERLATELPPASQLDSNPRKIFANSLGKTLTSGFEIEKHHITVLTWSDVDRANLKLQGAVLNIPIEFFKTHQDFSGCDARTYARGTCRFDLDFSTGNLQILNSQPTAAHDFKTSDVSSGASNHL